MNPRNPGEIRSVLSRIASLFHGKRLDADLDEELRAHIELAIAENRRHGMSQSEARAAALRSFGNLAQTKEHYRTQRGLPMLEQISRDLRFGLRQLRKSPGFAITAILTLALAIGANTAIFSVVQGVLLAPLPYPQPDRLVLLQQSRPNVGHLDVSSPDFLDWQQKAHSFEQMALVTWRDYNLTGPGTSEHLNGMEVSSGFFATLGIQFALGRELSLSEDRPNGAPAVILSNRLWKDRFASSPDVLGKSITIDGVDAPIIGVLPAGFRLLNDADLYTSFAQGSPNIYNDRTVHSAFAIARVKPGIGISQAQAELNSIQQNLDRLYPVADRNLGTVLTPLKQAIAFDVSKMLLLVLGAVVIVLLIACANVANLQLTRSAASMREFAVRSALGASRSRIVCQLLTESLLLSLAGGVLGVILAGFTIRIILAKLPVSLPRIENISLNLPVLFFALAITVAAGFFFGLAPALISSRVDVQIALKAGERGSTRARHRSQGLLVIVQIALTLILLIGSGLLLRTIDRLNRVNPGFDMQHVLSFQVGLSPSLTKTPTSTQIAFQQLLGRIREIPGIEDADLTNIVPLSGDDNSGPFWLGTRAPDSMQDAPHALYFWTGPNYLQTMKIPLLHGRFFTAEDNSGSAHVVVIDSVLAHTYFPGKDPVGQIITVAHWGPAQIVGVVDHIRHWGLSDPATYNPGQIYIPIFQLQNSFIPVLSNYLNIVVRTPLNADTVLPTIRNAVHSAGTDQPVYNIRSIHEIVSASMSAQRLPMILLTAFAALALVLAAIGIYGVLSYSVSQRIQEIGIRMALGADRSNVLRLLIRQGLALAISGIAIGTIAALILVRLLSSFSQLLYGITASDPLTFITVSLLLLSTAFLACYIPARRAMQIDPMQALRME